MDLLGRWLRQYGRPLALYTDRHSIFDPQDKGRVLPDATTQFGRALQELDIALIRAHSPQAKGRVERSLGTAQDRWVKGSGWPVPKPSRQPTPSWNGWSPTTIAASPNRPASVATPIARWAAFNLPAILSLQDQRVVSNDYVMRFRNRFYQLLPPVYPGERGGRVLLETRLDGTLAIRFQKHYLKYREVVGSTTLGGSAPKPPEFRTVPSRTPLRSPTIMGRRGHR